MKAERATVVRNLLSQIGPLHGEIGSFGARAVFRLRFWSWAVRVTARMARSRQVGTKRQRERTKAEQKQDKARRKALREAEKEARKAAIAAGEDPDLVGIAPGPQPLDQDDEEDSAEDAEEEEEQALGADA